MMIAQSNEIAPGRINLSGIERKKKYGKNYERNESENLLGCRRRTRTDLPPRGASGRASHRPHKWGSHHPTADDVGCQRKGSLCHRDRDEHHPTWVGRAKSFLSRPLCRNGGVCSIVSSAITPGHSDPAFHSRPTITWGAELKK